MARESSEERYLEEMPSCLRELFEQTSSEQQSCIANNAQSSTKSFKSILTFNGMELPPPLLTENERAEMRQYRREAVKCEAKMFERRREKYSNLLLQVMSVMDRGQEQRETTTLTEMQYDTEGGRERTLAQENYESTAGTLVHRNKEESTLYEPDHDRRYAWNVSNDERNAEEEQFAKSYIDWTENNHHENSRRINSQFSYLSHSLESSYANTDDQKGTYKHQLPRNEDSRQQFRSAPEGFESADFSLSSTMDNEVTELNRPFSHLSCASNGKLDPGDVSDTTVQKSSVLFPFDRNVQGSDSLGSTSLSMAFLDSSTSTVQSAIETQPRSTVPQLHIDSTANNTHYRHCEEEQALQSMDQPPDSRTNKRPVTSKQRPEKSKVQLSTVSKVPGISEQDKTLANLEKLRQKLLEEKQKHLEALKQQELKRLRNQKAEKAGDLHHTYAPFHRDSSKQVTEIPRPSSLPSSNQSDFKQSPSEESKSNYVSHNRLARTPPLRRPLSLPPGEMYSILELSGENLNFDTYTDNNNEPESSSDKENNVVDEVLRGNRNDAVVGIARSNAMGRINGEQSIYPSLQRKEPKHFVPGEDNRLFVTNGRDKFAKLSAHAKGFLTRRLMKTERVVGLVKTIKDTRDVLADISREDIQSVQEKMLKENVEGHLRVARSGLHDVFFKVPVKERMSYIANSRAIARAKEAKRRLTRSSVGQSKLSAVTLRAIQRRQEDHSVTQSANSETMKPKAEPREQKKKTWNIRVLKPQQGHTSPPLPDRTRYKKQSTRPATAPEKPLNSKIGKQDAVNRPKTTDNSHRNPERPSSLRGIGDGNQPAKRPARQSLGGAAQQPRITILPKAKKRLSLPVNAQPRIRRPGVTTDTVQRPKTASEVRRSSRLAANFSK